MFQNRITASALVALVSMPAFMIGQRLRDGNAQAMMWLLPCAFMVVLLASAIMRQSE
jgi:hypothetical protein